MRVRDIMTTNVVTIPSSTPIAQAKRILQAHKFRRLPVVDKGKLVGIVTEKRLEQVSPSKATSLTVWEMSYLLEKTAVKDIMEKHVLTVPPDMTAEESLAYAQDQKVGCLVVIENNNVVGILTTNDFIYNVVNPMIGLNDPGSRIKVAGGGELKPLEDILSTINELGSEVLTVHTQHKPDQKIRDVCIHIKTEDAGPLISALENKGYSTSPVNR